MPGLIAIVLAAALLGTAAPTRAPAAGHSERLALRARRGDRAARATLVEEHMGLVRAIAFRYRGRGLPLEDLVQEGAIGLLRAVDDFDPERGTAFSTYAFWRIRAAVTHALTADAQIVRIPRPVLERHRRVARERDRLSRGGCQPTVARLAEATQLREREVSEALAVAAVVSLDEETPLGRPLAETIADPRSPEPAEQLVASARVAALRAAVRRLSPRKRRIVHRHFGLAGERATLVEIGAEMHLSAERVRGLKDEALRDLASELAAAG
ncbi:MAG TPA: sigma-70 family RNA polymerase sigma factor [Gaiellaceae bacterium]